MNMKELDCRNMNCPLPVVNTKKYFDGIASGVADVMVDNETAFKNISKYAASNNFKVESKLEDGTYHICITKSEGNALEKCNCDEKFTIVIGSDKLGNGDAKLGEILIKSYIFALSESSHLPTDMLFFNSGVKLTVKDSSVIDSIKALADKGVKIQVCGTCLDFYEIKDKLEVGEVSNMYSIVETMNSSDKVVNL